LNSLYDSWQLSCIETAEPLLNPYVNGNCTAIPGWVKCLGYRLGNCTKTEINDVNAFDKYMQNTFLGSPTFKRNGNGAFLDSCYNHCEFQSYLWNELKVDSAIMVNAVHDWWTAHSNSPASDHTYVDCAWSYSEPYLCNPTCPR